VGFDVHETVNRQEIGTLVFDLPRKIGGRVTLTLNTGTLRPSTAAHANVEVVTSTAVVMRQLQLGLTYSC
jgi:hypothetical protein